MGPPPSPVAPPKRRYDQTPLGPPPNAQRPLAPNGETVTVEDEATPLSMPSKSSFVEDFVPPNSTIALPRSTSNEMVQKPRLQHAATLLPHGRVEEPPQAPRPPTTNQQRNLQGPPSGFFIEKRSEPRQPNQSSPGMTQQPPLHQSLSRQNERPRIDQPQRAQTLLPQQQRYIAAQQVPSVQQHYQNAPAISSPPSFHQQESSVQHQVPAHVMHARPSSSTASAPSLQITTKQEPDIVPFPRRDSLNQALHYAQSPAHSPVSMRPQPVFGTPQEPSRPNSTPTASSAEQTRPTPAKRSNITSLLNPNPAESPPPKRLSLEQNRTPSIQSPPSSIVSHVTTSQQPPTLYRREDGASFQQQSSGSRYHPESSSIISHSQSLLHQSSTPTQDNRRDWISQWDPRAVQPSTQSHHINHSQPSLSHRTMMGQSSLQHPGHVPSPPPQTQHQSSMQTPYRIPSTSSPHSRMPSYTGSGQPATQVSQSGTGVSTAIQPQSNHPHSALHSPVPGLPRSHASTSLESRSQQQGFETRTPLHQPHTFQQQQHAVVQQQELQQLQQQQQQQRAYRTFTSTPPGGAFLGQGQHSQQQSHQRHFSQEGRMEERK